MRSKWVSWLPAVAVVLVLQGCGGGGGGSSAPAVSSPVVAPADGITYSGPITIDRGGTYRGNWQSLDANVPTILITTREPVVIEGSNIRGANNLVQGFGVNLVLRDVRAVGLNPNVSGQVPGRFVEAEEFFHLAVENCDIEGTSGIYVREFLGNPAAGQTVRILRNRARNIDGRASDGRGGWSTNGYEYVQFFQMNALVGVPGIEIAWNEVINEPGRGRVEDNISIYKSSGTAGSPIDIHDNYIQGAYAYPPGGGYSGGGIMLGDGTGPTLADVPGFVRAHRNQVVSTGNYGLAITSGHDLEIFDNRVVSSGRIADGTIVTMDYGNAINVWDASNDKPAKFFNNVARDNLVGLLRPANGTLVRSDYWLPDCARDAAGISLCTDNRSLPDPIDGALEQQELEIWRHKVEEAGVTIGRRPAG